MESLPDHQPIVILICTALHFGLSDNPSRLEIIVYFLNCILHYCKLTAECICYH